MRRSLRVALPAVAPVAIALLLTCSLAVTLMVLTRAPGTPEGGGVSAAAVSARHVDLARFDSAAQWRTGKVRGLKVTDAGNLAFEKGASRKRTAGRTYDVGRWVSPWVTPGFSFTELIPSFSARTPGAAWIDVRVRGRGPGGTTSWDVMARWADKDKVIKPRSVSGQGDDATSVAVDTWRTPGLTSYQLQVRIYRTAGATSVPKLDLVTAMTSRLPAKAGATSRPVSAKAVELAVPRYSQMTHVGHYPKWGNGGEAWCSPTSASMVLGWYGRLPKASEWAWVSKPHTDPWVDLAARRTYDHAYRGTGNWTFTTAWAARKAGKGFVTRLRDLREAERLVRAGIPPVVSIAYRAGELTGSPIRSSNGHLLVVVGFTADGSVVANDPAAPTRAGVRRVYDRAQFERLWLNASGGMAYVIHDAAHPLPASSGNW
ncbi:C39 family peptidase [Nocardioides sp. zg-ZUI104]|uniref:C39 family peptidase n=1 Tax=Nocardioides faecalis TaxID=2803858 RepID=UPI001BD01919|nr:C39 family peptidase [Nocardioides faecalis]MBS4753389.1 C39 family peptidase [Nocardioides faecalis]